MIKRNAVWAIAGCVVCLLVIFGCENALTGSDENHDGSTNNGTTNNTALASVRSAVYDPVKGCAVETVHAHGEVQYSGHYNTDGHGHHGLQADTLCAVADCDETGLHQHNGTYYAGNDGCGHHGSGHE